MYFRAHFQKSRTLIGQSHYPNKGFALIVVLTLMVLLATLALGLLSLSTISLRSTNVLQADAVARANARLAVLIAIGELQKHAGPDRRITTNGTFSTPATGSVYGKELTDPNLKNPWLTGVWQRELETTRPLDPNASGYRPHPVDATKTAWIVSGNETAGSTKTTPATLIPDPTSTTNSPPESAWMLRQFLKDAGVDPAAVDLLSVKVPLVKNPGGAYGYWVADESQKAAIGNRRYNEDDFAGHSEPPSETELARLGLASSPSSINQVKGLESLPPSDDGAWNKLFTVSGLELAPGSTHSVIRKGIAENFHSLAAVSDGVQSDAKLGGLKRDLSMAFESDDAVFNRHPFYTREGQAKGSNSDSTGRDLASFSFVNTVDGAPWAEPFSHEMLFYRDSDTAPLFFRSPAGGAGGNFLRLPTWHALRDHYRTYKKVTNIDTTPTLVAVPRGLNFPSNPVATIAGAKIYLDRGNSSNEADTGNTRFKYPPNIRGGSVQVNPTTSGFTPVVARLQFGISFISGTGSDNNVPPRTSVIKMVADPIVTLWNPYNVKLDVTGYSLDTWLPDLNLVIEKQEDHKENRTYYAGDQCNYGDTVWQAVTTTNTEPSENEFWDEKPNQGGWILAAHTRFSAISQNYGSGNTMIINLANGGSFSMEPGELIVFSPKKDTPQDYSGTGGWKFDMERGWKVEGGIAMDRLRVDLSKPDTPPYGDVNQQRVIVDSTAMVRMTVEPLRGDWRNEYAAPGGDPFQFISRYPDGKFSKLTDRLRATDIMEWDNEGMPYKERVKIPGASDSAYTRDGFEIRTTYGGRKMLGTYNGGLPCPGMTDAMNVSQLHPVNKRWLGSFDWYLRNEGDATSYPVMIGKSNPRYNFQNTGASANLSPFTSLTTMPYQLKLKRETSETNLVQMDSASRGRWGSSNTSSGETHVSMFEIPTSPLVSLAQFQHFQASPFDHDPAYIIGASDSTPQIARDKASEVRGNDDGMNTFVDRSWYNNEVLFDSFFLSSLRPPDINSVVDDKKPLRNARFKFVTSGESPAAIKSRLNDTTGLADKTVAANVLMRGFFNVNSTSVEAWKAFLASSHGIDVAIAEPGSSVSLRATDGVPISRATTSNGDNGALWRGYRELDDTELTRLAEEVVKQVRLRGPFLSVSDFVNRRLKNDATGDAGALHIAIRDANLNSAFTKSFDTAKLSDIAAQTGTNRNYPFPAQAVGKIAQGAAPGYIQQGDLLQTIAPALTVRGDTFVIRGYGEARSKDGRTVTARAWCEATLQRTARYLDHTEDPNAPTADQPWADPENLKSATNRTFGRRFQIISFRWLNKNEI